MAIRKSLAGVAGVKKVRVSFKEKRAWLTVDESVPDRKLLRAITRAGPYAGVIETR